MGISGLLPLLKSIHRTTELKKYAGETLGIDGYGWLHRGAVASAIELAQGKPTRKYVDFAMHRVRMFQYFGVTPYLVFDGDYLPSKAKTEDSRLQRREEHRKIGLELLKAGKPSQAHDELQKAIDVTPEMARALIEELKKAKVPYVVAPYEADAQLVYLERQGLINGIVSEDSDLLVFGAKKLLTKMDKHGQCIEINRKEFCAVREISMAGWTDNEFRHMAIFSGCDYLEGVNNMGLKTAYRALRKYKTPERVIKMLQFDGKHKIPENYLAEFKQAELTFLHQRVFCPKKQELVFLTDPPSSIDVETMPFIGAHVDVTLARAIAVGDVNPITKKPIIMLSSPGKRRISQALGPVSVAERRSPLGKPISEYFKDNRRIPLGEMDPNCFNVEPNRDPNGVAEEAPRPRVFPLPRPYVDDATSTQSTSRRYRESTLRRQSEPISSLLGLGNTDFASQNRRRTAGPPVPVFQDTAGSSMRPPKKARLCEDLPTEDSADQTPVRSRYFSLCEQKIPAAKRADPILMSDDSVEEVLRDLPEFESECWRPVKTRRFAEEIDIFEERKSEVEEEILLPVGRAGQEDRNDPGSEVEVPASSPIQDKAVKYEDTPSASSSTTPLSARLQQFSYKSAKPATRIVHGLPTPSSSMQKPAAPPKSNTPSKNLPTPMLTPLQRMGARALQRSVSWAPSSTSITTSTTPKSSKSGNRRPSRPSLDALPVNPSFVPLPKVDLAEVEALNKALGSEDQIIPDSDGENDPDCAWRLVLYRRHRHSSIWYCVIAILLSYTFRSNDRLRDHAKAFDGLLSLIPAKMYYGTDTSDQWKKKKQTKDEAKAAKRGKLDPDIMEERARNKRKLQEMQQEDDESAEDEEDDDSLLADVEKEKPEESTPKKQKLSEDAITPKEEKKLAKQLKKEEKKKAKAEKTPSKSPKFTDAKVEAERQADVKPSTEADVEEEDVVTAEDHDMAPIDVSSLVTKEDEGPNSPVFDTAPGATDVPAEAASTTTSINSAIPPSDKPRHIKIPTDTTALRARLEAKINALRAKRKADGADGKPIRTREELIQERREKQAQRKAHKKELRQKAKEEEDRKREEQLASARNSPGSILSPRIGMDLDDDRNANHFAFGRVAFADGVQMSHDLSYEKDASAKKKGPSDPKTALAKLEAQKKRIAALGDVKRNDVLEKETWLAARRRAEGEKVRDDETLLKKAVKRKEKAKKKSETEWKERAKGVQDAIKGRQKKREDNIRKRREEKGGKGKKKKGVATKAKNRPGFEGGFGGKRK
ncbi:hypothetical protein QBC46DRAFT_457857 [Diplogelasinospora grovesii]|uniref:Exonuclease 1 n=1 Tax=Diplogelasinospora grovesii TaxID=303347 RepID=A0AAN6NA88_9PEZI|nr:hypothetical protein QBC46DRAFT_457857 [Diplogelasinospora grovesii]